MADVKIHLPMTSVTYSNLPSHIVDKIVPSMKLGRPFTIEAEETFGGFKPVRIKRIFNPAMVTMVEITEEVNGQPEREH